MLCFVYTAIILWFIFVVVLYVSHWLMNLNNSLVIPILFNLHIDEKRYDISVIQITNIQEEIVEPSEISIYKFAKAN